MQTIVKFETSLFISNNWLFKFTGDPSTVYHPWMYHLSSLINRERFVQFVQPGSQINGERGARTYNGGLGAVSQWGPGAKPQVHGNLKAKSTTSWRDFSKRPLFCVEKCAHWQEKYDYQVTKISLRLCIITQLYRPKPSKMVIGQGVWGEDPQKLTRF